MGLLPIGTEIEKSDADSTNLSAAIDTVSGLISAVGAALITHESDANAHATQFGLKANLNSPTFTGTVGGITAAMVGAPSGSGTSSGTNTGDQDLSSYLALSGGTLTGKLTSSYSPGLSDCAIVLTGAVQTGGTSTTNLPALFFQPAGATPGSAYSTGGTFIGVNAGPNFAGRFLDFRVDGGSGVFSINSAGWVTMSGVFASSRTGTSGAAAVSYTGSLFTGGTGTTTVPHVLSQPSGATAVTTWNTAGTHWAINAASGFAGNFIDLHVNGGASLFAVTSGGVVNATGFNGTVGATTPTTVAATTITTTGNIVTEGTVGFSNTGVRAGGIAVGRGAAAVAGEQIQLWNASTNIASLTNAGMQWGSGYLISVSATTASSGTKDTSLSRSAAGVWQFGNGTANALGSVLLTNLTASGTITGAYQTLTPVTFAGLPPASAHTGKSLQVSDRDYAIGTSNGINWLRAGTSTVLT
jgi:hypothetical protein